MEFAGWLPIKLLWASISTCPSHQCSFRGIRGCKTGDIGIKSDLDSKEMDRRSSERKSRFLDVPGLIQIIYGRDKATGDVCGIYFLKIRKRS